MEETKLPLVSDGLLAYLEKTFPNEYPIKEISSYQLGFGAGEQWVIQHLKEVKKWSEEDKDVQD